MNTKKHLLLSLCTLLPVTAILAQTHSKPKNVLLIMADDMGAMELGCYGSKLNVTPNFDALAQSGYLFSTFFATPVCTPSRVALMTGKYGIHTNHLNMANLPGGKGRGFDLSKDEYTFGQMFKDAGYATAMAGKWQLSGRLPNLIRECGFDEYMTWIYLDYLEKGEKYKGGFYPEGGKKTSRYWHPGIVTNGKHIATTNSDYGPDIYSQFIMDFIKKNAAQNKPFFAYYPMNLIHRPWVETPDHPGVKPNSPEALNANVEYCDKIIGRIIKTLDDAGIRENTLVIFIGDNGTQNIGKQTVTEWGPRTPCMISCPSIVEPNVLSPELVDIPDILATILDYTNIEPRNYKDLDGQSLMPLLTGQDAMEQEFAIAFYGNYRVIRDKEWLLESNTEDTFGELYYCGKNRTGLGYERVTDFSKPKAKAARERFEAYINQHFKEVSNMTDEEKDEFAEFVARHRSVFEQNIRQIYNDNYGEKIFSE